MKKITIAVVLALASIGAQANVGNTITGLNNTGAGFAAHAQDTNYVLTIGSGPATNGYVAANNSWPVGPWMVNNATSSWLTPALDQSTSFDPLSNGIYTWATTFDLTGYNAATAGFTGRFAADNSAVAYLNGHQIGTSSGFTAWSNFSTTASDFISGVNTVTFVVTNLKQNGGNPTGLRAEFLTSNVSPVPEPETYGMMLMGLGLMGFVARRRKNKQA